MSNRSDARYNQDIELLSHEELKALYRSLRESRANVKKHNDALTKWSQRASESVTALATDGSLVFQAMAEKAGVRAHPSVTKAVELFDLIAHPQWKDEPLPKFEWPTDWDFDDTEQWSGDADMQLNAPIARAIEIMEQLRFSVKGPVWEAFNEITQLLDKALREGIEGYKDANGFKSVSVRGQPGIHYRDLDREQLIELVGSISFMALDLAQDMAFANDALRRDLRASVYRRVCGELYSLSHLSMEWGPQPQFDVKVLGGEGLPF